MIYNKVFGEQVNMIVLLGISLLIWACSNAPSVQETKANKVDQLFETHTNELSPGYVLGIIQNGELVYSKGYGYANLENRIPFSDSSAVYIGSMAKQFTAAALLILESEGKIDLNKAITDYLPEFPIYKNPITINHLIHHTSGIRETNSMQLFQGIDLQFEEVFDTEDLFQLVLQQKDLNFQPGEEFRYSSGGYAVLAKIVERVSGIAFRTFVQEHIFDRLGMHHTVVCDDHNEIIFNRADSYWPAGDGKYERRSHLFDAYGDGGIITTLKDLVEWDKAFYVDNLGVTNFASKMYQTGVLNSGEEIEYARALQIRSYRGLKMVTHNGGMLGFRVDMVRFPEVETSFILLGNSAYLDPTGDILKIVDIWLENELDSKTIQQIDAQNTSESIELSPEQMKTFAGYYWTDQTNYYRRITFKDDSLFFDSGNPDFAHYLIPVDTNEFLINDYFMSARIQFMSNNQGEKMTAQFGNVSRIFRKFDPAPPRNIEELEDYLGIYYSDELSSKYKIYKDNSTILLKINQQKPMQLFPVLPNSRVVWNGKQMVWIGFGELKFHIDSFSNVTGLTIGDSRVGGIRFIKIQQ